LNQVIASYFNFTCKRRFDCFRFSSISSYKHDDVMHKKCFWPRKKNT